MIGAAAFAWPLALYGTNLVLTGPTKFPEGEKGCKQVKQVQDFQGVGIDFGYIASSVGCYNVLSRVDSKIAFCPNQRRNNYGQ